MANVLEFALGLETGGFVTKVVSAEAVLGGLREMANGVEDVFRHVAEQFERGAGLKELSNRTGETVSTLYQLQEVFKEIGLSSDGVPVLILRMQRALSGISESGQSTNEIFARLGINMRDLSTKDAATQMTTLMNALAKLPKSQATGAAYQIFGREGAGDILQLMRSQEIVNQTMQDTAKAAKIHEALAAAAERIHVAWAAIERDVENVWAQVATAIAPILEKIEQKVKAMPFEEWGRKIASVVFGLEKAFESGNLAELLGLAIRTGFEEALPYGEAFIKAFGAAFLDIMRTVADGIGELVGSSLINRIVSGSKMAEERLRFSNAQSLMEQADQASLAATRAGNQPEAARERKRAGEFRAVMEDAIKQMSGIESDYEATGKQITADAISKMAAAHPADVFAKAFAPEGESQQATLDKLRMKRLLALAGLDYDAYLASQSGGNTKPTAPPSSQDLAASKYRPEFTSLEKMGFVMSGLGHGGMELRKVDLLSRIAAGTDRLVAAFGAAGADAPQLTNQV